MANNFHDAGRLENVFGGDPADESVHPDDRCVTEPHDDGLTFDETAQRYVVACAVADATHPLRMRIQAHELQIVALIAHLDVALAELRRDAPAIAACLDRASAHVRVKPNKPNT